MVENILDMSRNDDSKIVKASSLKDIKNALRSLGIYDQSFTHVSGLVDLSIDEYSGFTFFSSKPTNMESNALGNSVSGKNLALLLFRQLTDPTIKMFALTKDAKLGGWEFMVVRKDDDVILRADRTLLGSSGKVN